MWNRILGPLFKVQKEKTGAQAETALVAAKGANAQLQLVGITGTVIVAEAGKFLYLKEQSGTIALFRQRLDTALTFTHIFSEEGMPITKNKAINWESDATSAEIEFTALYRVNPPGDA